MGWTCSLETNFFQNFDGKTTWKTTWKTKRKMEWGGIILQWISKKWIVLRWNGLT